MMQPYSWEALTRNWWAKVKMDGPIPPHCPDLGPCWLWTGAIKNNGYGNITYKDEERGGKVTLTAHRAGWLINVGDVPDGVNFLHRCDNRRCVNYERHLCLGSQSDNMHDAYSKGRM